MKKQLLFVINHLTIGGIQKTLISALKVLDYDKYDVTVYLRKNRTDLLPFIDNRAKIIINKDKTRYYRKPGAIFYHLLIEFNLIIGRKEKAEKLNARLNDLIRAYSMKYEQKAYFADKKYDIAIAYAHGYPAYFTADYINADEKIIFFHVSTNELPEVHKKFITKFDKAAAVHGGQKKLISEWYPSLSDKIYVVENFVDAELIKEQSREVSLPENKVKAVLCSCGRFAPVKGFDMAVEAAKKLKEKGFDFVWYFVGDGPEKTNIERLIEKNGLDKNIILTGMQKNPYPYIDACDIYIQPSYEEAWGMTIAEANRLSRPVISTKTLGGMRLIENEKNGILCDINPQSLADAIINLNSNKELYAKIKNNLENADYSCEGEKYKEQWKKLLEE
ncbi:MAG: glycosyltransferase [Clostridia bacterium]|nr:glycosyltransferase [Clostridia bacterium]